MYTYRDIVTGKVRKTQGKFTGFTEQMGLLNVRYARFQNRASVLYVPVYLLTKETIDELNKISGVSEVVGAKLKGEI